VLGALAGAVVLSRVRASLGLVGLLTAAVAAFFFRSPRRVTIPRPGVVTSAADGVVTRVDEAPPPRELGLPNSLRPRVSVFLSLLDVHVQRAPIGGVVERIAYHPGRFWHAGLDKVSEENERNSVLLRAPDGQYVVVTQIAGMIARRILCEVVTGDAVNAGSVYGLIRFGSRVDLYLPPGSRVLTERGRCVVGGETPIARLQKPEPPSVNRGRRESSPCVRLFG